MTLAINTFQAYVDRQLLLYLKCRIDGAIEIDISLRCPIPAPKCKSASMNPVFSKRKPKRIARDDPPQAHVENDGMSISLSSQARSLTHHSRLIADQTDTDNGPVVRRPGAPKHKSKLRMSFAPDHGGDEDSNIPSADESAVAKAPRGKASTALQDKLSRTTIEDASDTRPSYSRLHLDELRASTPSTPAESSLSTTPNADEKRLIDIDSKFGAPKTSLTTTTSIPSTTEITEKKARRARLALEHDAEATTTSTSEDFISLEQYDSDGEFKPQRMQVDTYRAPTDKDSRLVRDDEDILEGFEDFTEPTNTTDSNNGRINTFTGTRKEERRHRRAEREAMRSMIAHAENSSDGSDVSDSDASAQHHFDAAQTSHGMDGLSAHAEQRKVAARPRQPKETMPVMKLSVALAGLRERVGVIEVERGRLEGRLKEIAKEREECVRQQEFVQKSLEEGSAEMERLDVPSGGGGGGGRGVGGENNGSKERGLESIGTLDGRGDEDVGVT